MDPISTIKESLPTKSSSGAGKESAAVSGKTMPEVIPEPAHKPVSRPRKVRPPDMQKAVQQIQHFLSASQRDLQFRVDESSGRTVFTVLNPHTQETIRQIPSAEILALISLMQQQGPHFISETV